MSKENKPLKAIDADFVSLELDRLELNEGQPMASPRIPARYWRRSSTF